MGITTLLKFFQPKDRIFYTLFEQVSDNLEAMAQDLVKALEASKNGDNTLLKKMKDYEHENDRITHKIFLELSKNFITPFDREDIHNLTASLDDIADFMYASSRYILLYNTPHMPAYDDLAALILKSVLQLKKAIYKLRNYKDPKEIAQCCVEVNRLENEADDVFSKSLANLFESKIDVIEIIKIKNVLEYLEDVNDKCEDVANIIESILVKYS